MDRKKVSELAKQVRGVSYKPEDLHDSLDNNSVILLRANNINDGKINFEDVVYVDRSKVSKEQYERCLAFAEKLDMQNDMIKTLKKELLKVLDFF